MHTSYPEKSELKSRKNILRYSGKNLTITGIHNNEVINMKMQFYLIFGFIFTLVIATFAVINVSDVEINYLFGTAKWPLVLVILGSAGIGGLTVGLFSLIKIIQLQRQVRKLQGIHHERADLRHDDKVVVDSVDQAHEPETVGSRVEERHN
jgi:uncharacterized integral membrane protein